MLELHIHDIEIFTDLFEQWFTDMRTKLGNRLAKELKESDLLYNVYLPKLLANWKWFQMPEWKISLWTCIMESPKQAMMQVLGLFDKKPLLGFAFKLTTTISLQLLGVDGHMACSSSAGKAGTEIIVITLDSFSFVWHRSLLSKGCHCWVSQLKFTAVIVAFN